MVVVVVVVMMMVVVIAMIMMMTMMITKHCYRTATVLLPYGYPTATR
jgi:hypothetical protein